MINVYEWSAHSTYFTLLICDCLNAVPPPPRLWSRGAVILCSCAEILNRPLHKRYSFIHSINQSFYRISKFYLDFWHHFCIICHIMQIFLSWVTMGFPWRDLLAGWLTDWLTNQPTNQPAITQPVKKFPAFYGTQRFITMVKTARQWSLSWARYI